MAYREIAFIKADPSGNTTIFVLSPLPRAHYVTVARALMQDRVLCAEQVGFIERTETGSRLQMMGGEFCGNASRSYAAWLAMAGGAEAVFDPRTLHALRQRERRLEIEVSGHQGRLTAQIEDVGSPYGCFAEIAMPEPRRLLHGEDTRLGPYSLVVFEGISHGVLWQRAADEGLLTDFRRLLRGHGLDDGCCGLMFVEGERPLRIRPLVYVGEVGSLVWENSCGSGSLATLCALADRDRRSYRRYGIQQPGGELQLSARHGASGITETRLAGTVYFRATGSAHLDI